ncbi:MAG TPA: C40 family peptidase [Flavobacteriaceae bacterium]|nr:C40 family peptidase [Flavobacteriaceae bacterium]
MEYGICHLSLVALRAEAADTSEMVTQVLYGETFQIHERKEKWSHIRLSHDSYEGWIDNKQFVSISEENYLIQQNQPLRLSSDLVDFIQGANHELIPITVGSTVSAAPLLNHHFEGASNSTFLSKEHIIVTASLFLNAPYLWGGKSPFGIDCSGFTQLVYKIHGQFLLRDASLQATQGEALSFIEESEPGDLAFFDNEEGRIIHVGIIMADNYIIHAHGKVRIDRLDHSGIYNSEYNRHTHKLRVIKRIF